MYTSTCLQINTTECWYFRGKHDYNYSIRLSTTAQKMKSKAIKLNVYILTTNHLQLSDLEKSA